MRAEPRGTAKPRLGAGEPLCAERAGTVQLSKHARRGELQTGLPFQFAQRLTVSTQPRAVHTAGFKHHFHH